MTLGWRSDDSLHKQRMFINARIVMKQTPYLSHNVRGAEGVIVRCAGEPTLKHNLTVIACSGSDGA